MEDAAQYLDSLITLLKSTQQKIAVAAASLEPEVQEELAKLLSVSRKIKSLLVISQLKNNKIKQAKVKELIPNIETAIYALQGVPNKILVKNIRRDVEFAVRQLENPVSAFLVNGFKSFLYLTTTPTKVIFGLFVALPVHLAAPIILAQLLAGANLYIKPILAEQSAYIQNTNTAKTDKEIFKNRLSQYEFDEASALLLLCAIAGSTGSVISILTRIEQYKNEEYGDSLLPFFVGAFKPMIGAFFGILIFAIFNSTILPISITKDDTKPATKWFGFMAISFVVGFSERFAKDIVSQAEKMISTEKLTEDVTPSSTTQLPADEPIQNNQTQEQ